MGCCASKADSYEDNMKSYYRVPRSVGDMARIIGKESKIMVSIISNAIESNKGIRNDRDLNDLVHLFSSHGKSMLAFCKEIERCLNSARDSQLNLRAAGQYFKKGRSNRALEELEKFFNSENPFTGLPVKLEKVRQQQEKLEEKLKIYNKKIKKKRAIAIIARISAGFIFTTYFLTLFTCQVYAVYSGLLVTLPTLVAAAPATFSAWAVRDKQCKSYSDGLKRHQDLVGLMKDHGRIEKTNFDEIKMAAEKTGNLLQSLKRNAGFTLEGEEKVKIGFKRIEKKMPSFAKSIEKLGECVEKCSADLKKGSAHLKKGREEIKMKKTAKVVPKLDLHNEKGTESIAVDMKEKGREEIKMKKTAKVVPKLDLHNEKGTESIAVDMKEKKLRDVNPVNISRRLRKGRTHERKREGGGAQEGRTQKR